MKKFFKFSFLVVLLIFTLFSCDDEQVYKVSLKVFNVDTSTYTSIRDIDVIESDKFSDIKSKIPPVDPFEKEGKTYTFKGWTTDVSLDEINTTSATISDNTLMKDIPTLYAVYEVRNSVYTIEFMTFDKETDSYSTTYETTTAFYNTEFINIKPTDPEGISTDYQYTFKHWTLNKPSEIDTTSEKVQDTYFIKSNLKLYAVYEKRDAVKYTVILKSFNASTTPAGYTTPILEKNDVAYGTALKNIEGYDDAPVIEAFEGRKYTFKGWSTTAGTTTPKTDEADFAKEQGVTTSVILYAVYEGEDINITVKFMSYKNDDSTPGYIDCINPQENIPYGTEFNSNVINKPQTPNDVFINAIKYSFVGWADVQDPQAILEEYNNTDVPGNTQIKENKTFYAIYKGDYLTFTATEDTDISFDFIYDRTALPNPISLQYLKKGDTEFRVYTWDNGTITQVSNTTAIGDKITLTVGDEVYFKGENETFTYNDSIYGNRVNTYVNFKSTGEVKASGNVMSLVGGGTAIPNKSCFYNLFSNCHKLLTAPSLPATTLEEDCYHSMFSGCTSLTTAPSLPATTLEENCYHSMFSGCTSLTTAPSLSAPTLADGCYSCMFQDCTSLTDAPELSSETLAESCYAGMFSGCTSLTTAPELSAKNLAMFCYNGMFKGCTSLTTAPSVLPAEDAKSAMICYYFMFEGCTSLERAPVIKAKNYNDMCFESMFSGCTSLNYIECLITEPYRGDKITLDNWVQGVPEGGTFVCKTAAEEKWEIGVNGIPNGWSVDTVD